MMMAKMILTAKKEDGKMRTKRAIRIITAHPDPTVT
jgi:hypothetical protein